MKKVLVYYSLFFMILLASCSPIYYYSPNTHNVPVLKAKGDVRAGLSSYKISSATWLEYQYFAHRL